MGDLYTEFDKEDKDDIDLNDDKQIDVIEDLNNDDDIEAVKQLIREELKNPEADTSQSSEPDPEPVSPGGGDMDTSGKAVDEAGQSENKVDESSPAAPAGTPGKDEPEPLPDKSAGDFILTEYTINSYPEEYRGILSKYKGKSRAEIEKAIANAVIFKTGQDAVQALIDTQKETGKARHDQSSGTGSFETKSSSFPNPEELPPLAENEEVNKAVSAEALKRLRMSKYPDMPADLNSEEGKNWLNAAALRQLKPAYPDLPLDPGSPEYQEFLRDLHDENPELANDFLYEKRRAVQNIQNEFVNTSLNVKNDLQQLIYVRNNYKSINNSRLEAEVEAIKKELNQLGLTEQDLGINLLLQKDESGSFYNNFLSPLMLNGESSDPNVIGYIGQFPILKENKLREKFLYANNIKILNLLAGRRVRETQKETERLKDTNLNSLGGQASSGAPGAALTLDKINSTTDEGALKKEKARLEEILSKG
jgi:hypothetical protein